MVIDIEVFSANKAFILDWFNTLGGKDINRTISYMAAITSVPCIVIAFYLGEETNWHPQTIEAIKRLTDFYGYTTILGKPEGSPV